MHPYVHCSIIYNHQNLEAAKCPSVDERAKKLWYIYAMEYYSVVKKKEILTFVTTWMNLESIMLKKKSQKKTNTMWFHVHVETNEQNKVTKKIEIDSSVQKQTDSPQMGGIWASG